MSLHAISIAQRWVMATLTADASLMTLAANRAYWTGAPPGTARPYVVARVQGGFDQAVMPHTRVLTRVTLAVYGVSDSNSAQTPLGEMATRIDAALHGKRGSVTGGGTVLSCLRRQPLILPVVDGRDRLTCLGGVYDIELQEA